MKNKKLLLVAAVGLILLFLASTAFAFYGSPYATTNMIVAGMTAATIRDQKKKEEVIPPPPPPLLTHKQEVWLYALEWCESQGELTAINPKDLDNTPSYYSFQFKPGTFKDLGVRYKIIKPEDVDTDSELMTKLKDYELQKAIVTQMILDPKTVWLTQFPGCTKKLGKPPVSKIVTASTSS